LSLSGAHSVRYDGRAGLGTSTRARQRKLERATAEHTDGITTAWVGMVLVLDRKRYWITVNESGHRHETLLGGVAPAIPIWPTIWREGGFRERRCQPI